MKITVRHTGKTIGHEHLHGEIRIDGKLYTYAAHSVRSGIRFLVHGTDIACIGFAQMIKKIKKYHGREAVKNG